MWGIDEINNYLKENLKPSRYGHTLGVVKTAVKLAEIYNVDKKKAEIAALSHDIAKNIDFNEMKNIIKEENIILSIDEENTKELWHAIIAPVLGRKIFNIEDEEILNAMRWHTTGKEDMTTLEKIIYLADLIEPSRNFDGVEEIRKIALENLDSAMIKAITHTTIYLLNNNCAVDINTVKARNYLLYNIV